MSGTALARERIRSGLSRFLDVGLGALVIAIAVGTAIAAPAAMGTLSPAAAIAITAVAGVAIAFRRRRPVPVLGVVAGAVLVEQWFGASLNFGSLALVIAVFTVASEAPRRTSLVVLAVMPAYLAAALALYAAIHATALELFVAEYLSGVAVFLVAWFAGDSVRTRRQRVQDLEARADRLEREQAERARVAVQNERALIARELHDIVAHSVSVMVVQATAAQRILDDQPDEAREAMHSIETTGREALGEMRRLLGILRSEEGRAPLEPQRGLAGIGAVIEGAGRGGVSVDLVVEGEPRPLSPGVDLAAYRIIQEALTNTIKHAAPAHAVVQIRFEPDSLGLDISDDGSRREDTADPGHGLIGMEERVRLYGGDFEAGPRHPAGFAVHARLPTTASAG